MPALGNSDEPGPFPESTSSLTESNHFFRSAKPIWPVGREKEMNLFVGFRAVFDVPTDNQVSLQITGATVYRVFLNGAFLAWGPARGPHGFFRVDELDITQKVARGRNVVCIEVAGYNVSSYYVINQPSFLQAEILAGSQVLASTGGEGGKFEAVILSQRIQKVQRYTFQRAFSEIYHLQPHSADWLHRSNVAIETASCQTFQTRNLIPRRVPLPDYARRQPEQLAASGTFQWGAPAPKSLAEDHSVPFGAKISFHLLGFPEEQIPELPYLELQKTRAAINNRIDEPYVVDQPLRLKANDFKIVDFGTNLTGFIGATVNVQTPAKIYFTFDETLMNGDIDFTRLMCVNIVAYTLAPGTYHLESFEPYVLRFLKIMVTEGECEVEQIYLREYTTPDVWSADFHCPDDGLNQLYAAGRESYRANTVDIFMDTPSRERAGWLCDSSFTAQVSPLLSGHTRVEKSYLENFLLPDHFANIPDGMVPMCYPADHYDGGFNNNWALWFLIQLEQYLLRSGDRKMIDAFRPRVTKLLNYFKPFVNSDGLLENLKGQVFVEWSKANDYTQELSYPTNMLYSAALAAVGQMYHLPEYLAQAESIRKVILKQSFDGEFFVDNALRKGSSLVPTHNRSETCQYYAFYFGIADFETHSKLWHTLYSEFGPQRYSSQAYADIPPSNAFMGIVMRLELLSRSGRAAQTASEMKSYFLPMAELTGTLWENMGNEASMNHAFGSQVIVRLYRDVLGLSQVDTVKKKICLRFADVSLESCEGRVPTPEGFVTLRWARKDATLTYQLDAPSGYKVEVESRDGITAVPRRFPHGKISYGYKIEGGYK